MVGGNLGGFHKLRNLLLAQGRASHPRAIQATQPITRQDLAEPGTPGASCPEGRSSLETEPRHVSTPSHSAMHSSPLWRAHTAHCPVSFRVRVPMTEHIAGRVASCAPQQQLICRPIVCLAIPVCLLNKSKDSSIPEFDAHPSPVVHCMFAMCIARAAHIRWGAHAYLCDPPPCLLMSFR